MTRQDLARPGRRIVVVGTSGSGKTTLASTLATILQIPHVEMDSLYWESGWMPATEDVFRARVAESLVGDAWVIDGNYSSVKDEIWTRADTLIWLDYSLAVALWRVTRRTIRRLITREELWRGNRERLSTFFARDSIILWTLTTHSRRRSQYGAYFAQPDATHLTLIRIRTPAAARRWLAAICEPDRACLRG